MVSMKKIAERLGVSRTTVSNILNGHTSKYSYKPETIDLVFKTAIEMGYVINHVAASLKTGKTLTIAIVVPDIANIYYVNLIKEIEQLSRFDNYNVMICISEEDVENENRILLMLRSRMVDGIIISPVSLQKSFLHCEQLPPTVCFDRQSASFELPSITLDNQSITVELAYEMKKLNAKSPFFMGGNKDDSSNIGRYHGLKQVFHLSQCNSPSAEFGIFNEHQAYECIKSKVERNTFNHDSVFLTTNNFVYGVIRAIEDFGLNINCIAGFEDFFGKIGRAHV